MNFIRPCEGRLTSGFRTRSRPDHHGIDLAKPGIVEVKAAASGRVMRSYTSSSYGEVIFILHNFAGHEWESVYAHLRTGSRKFNVGANVSQGEVIGLMGNTGHSFGQHLHFEIHKGRWNINKTNAVDPWPLIQEGDEEEMLKEKFEPKKHSELTPGQRNTLKRLASIGVVAQDYKPSEIDLPYMSMMDALARKLGTYK